MSQKVSNLIPVEILNDEDLVYVVKDGVSNKMRKDLFAQSLLSNGNDGLVSGVIKWVSGLTFESVNLVWRKNNQLFTANGSQRTAIAADPTNPRIDIFYGDDSGNWGIIAGTPAATPVKPSVDDVNTQVELSFTTIDANGTEPIDFINEVQYDEFGTIVGGESDVTLTANGTLNSTEQAFSGTKSIKFDNTVLTDQATFQFPAVKNSQDLVTVSMAIYIDFIIDFAELENVEFWVSLFDSTGTVQIGNKVIVNLPNGQFNPLITGVWQEINIPASDFNLGVLDYGQLVVQTKIEELTFFMDLVVIQEGNTGTPTPNPADAVAKYTQQIGDGATTSFDVLHNIGKQFVIAQIFETTGDFRQVECEIKMINITTTKFIFNTAPLNNEYTIVIIG